MKWNVVVAIAAFASHGCVLRVPGHSLGPFGAGTPVSSSSGSSAASEGQEPVVAESPQTTAWRAVLDNRILEQQLFDLHERLEDLPRGLSSGADQHAGWSLSLLKNDKLAEVAKECAAGTYRGETLKLERRTWLKADNICRLVIDRENLLKKQIHAWGVALCDWHLWEFEKEIGEIEKSGKVSVSLLLEAQSAQKIKEYVATFARKTFDAIGEQVPPEALAKADDIFKRRQDVIAKLAAVGKIEKAVKADPGAERAIRDVYSKRFDVKSVLMLDADWKVVRNDFGILLRHYKNAEVLVKAKDGSFCARVPASVAQQYEDLGKYSKAYGVDEYIEGWPVACP